MHLDLPTIRSKFPALGRKVVFLDNPGGTQIAQPVLDRIQTYLVEHNANHGGAFQTSRESDTILEKTRGALMDFFNASHPGARDYKDLKRVSSSGAGHCPEVPAPRDALG